MDFSPSEELVAIRDLARQIFADRVSHERLLALEKQRRVVRHRAVERARARGPHRARDSRGARRRRPRDAGAVRGVRGAGPPHRAGAAARHRGARRAADRRVRNARAARALAAPGRRARGGALARRWSSTRAASRARRARGRVASGGVWRLDGEKHCVPAADRAQRDPGSRAHARGRGGVRWSIRARPGVTLERADRDAPRAAVARAARGRAGRGRARRAGAGRGDRRVDRRARGARARGDPDRCRRGGDAAHRALHHRAQAVRQGDRARSRASRCARPTPGSTSRRCAAW